MVAITTQAKSFFIKCKRVWHALKKPSKKEFEQVSKVSAIGILVLGAIGYAFSIVMKFLF